jgi:hypothetical protein
MLSIFVIPGTPDVDCPTWEAQRKIIVIDHVPLAKASGRTPVLGPMGEMVPRQNPFRVSAYGMGDKWFETFDEAKAYAQSLAA